MTKTMTTPIITSKSLTIPVMAPRPSHLELRRLQGVDGMPDALRIETSVGRVMILSGADVQALCEGLADLFPEMFE